MTEQNLDILSPRKGTPFSKLFQMCNGKHVDERDDDESESLHSSSAVSDDDVQPAEATARSVTFSEFDGTTTKQDGDATSSVSVKVCGWDAGILLAIAVGVAIVAYEYNEMKASAADE